jgi:hypothetical protein
MFGSTPALLWVEVDQNDRGIPPVWQEIVTNIEQDAASERAHR